MAAIEISVEPGSHHAALLHFKSDVCELLSGLCLIIGALLLIACEKMFCGLVMCHPASSLSAFTYSLISLLSVCMDLELIYITALLLSSLSILLFLWSFPSSLCV